MNNTLKTIAEQITYGGEFKFKTNLTPNSQIQTRVYEEINGSTNATIMYCKEEPFEILLTNTQVNQGFCYDYTNSDNSH